MPFAPDRGPTVAGREPAAAASPASVAGSAASTAAAATQSPTSAEGHSPGSEAGHFSVPDWFDPPPAPAAAVPAPQRADVPPGGAGDRPQTPEPGYQGAGFGVPAWFDAAPEAGRPTVSPGASTAQGGGPAGEHRDAAAPSEGAGHFGVPDWFDRPPAATAPGPAAAGRGQSGGWVDHDGNWYPAPGEPVDNASAYPAAYLRDPEAFRAEHEDVGDDGDDGDDGEGDGDDGGVSYDRRPPATTPAPMPPGPRPEASSSVAPTTPRAQPAAAGPRRRPTYRLGPPVLPAAPVPAVAAALTAGTAMLGAQRHAVVAEPTTTAVSTPPVPQVTQLPPSPAASGAAASGSSAAPAEPPVPVTPPAPEQDLDVLAARLYDRIRGRLRAELLIDRERANLLTDLR